MFDNISNLNENENVLENLRIINNVLIDVCKSQKDTIKRTDRIMCIMIVSLSIVICTMLFCIF